MSDSNYDKKITTRFAPSPTGWLHVGAARSALFDYLFARQYGGKFILRIEDTDRERSFPEYEKSIMESMKWLSLDWDEFYRQSERGDIYRSYIEKLLQDGSAYISQEDTSGDEENKRSQVIRFRNPGIPVTFSDIIRGEVTFNTEELGDFVIAKSEAEPLYHLSVVIDDAEMDVSHIIRGEEHISNTPRQILLQRAFGFSQPHYAHLPIILAPDRSKLSKRHGAVSVTEFRRMGYLPEALVNYLALLGWNPGNDRELFTPEELVEHFDLSQVQKGGAVFDDVKFNWINRQYLNDRPVSEHLTEMKRRFNDKGREITDDDFADLIWRNIVAERISYYGEINDLIDNGELEFLFRSPEYQPQRLIWKDTGAEQTIKYLEKVKQLIISIPSNKFNKVSSREAVWDYASEQGRGSVLWPMRMALCGLDKSPDPFVLAETLGREETIKRLDDAITALTEQVRLDN